MPDSRVHPPRPVLSYRLGVAGTRDLGNADSGLAARIDEFLQFLKDRIYAVWKENSAYFDSKHHPRLILVCSLAKGVDLLVAELAEKKGYELHVPIAFDRELYSKKNFGTGKSKDKDRFDKLWENAKAKLSLDGDPSLPDSIAYDACGSVLVDNCDVLLAIWDFGPGKGAGGTADSVAKAMKDGVLLVRMQPERAEGPFFHDDGKDRPYQELKPAIRRQLLPGITPGKSALEADRGTMGRVRREQARLQRFYREREWRFDFSWPYRIANAVLSLSVPTLTFRLPRYSEASEKSWPRMSDETFIDSPREHFKGFDQWADGLAVFYANCTRSTVAITLLLGAALLAYALAMKLWPILGAAHGFPILEGASILFLTGLVVIARWRSVHVRWLQYRMLSEFLRSAALASAIGGLPLPQSRFREKETASQTWVSFYFQAAVRSSGLLNAMFDDTYLADFRQLLISRLNGQVDFHTKRRELYRQIDRNIRSCGIFIFVVSLAGAVLQIGGVLWPGATQGLLGVDVPRHLSNLSQIFPIFGGALAAFVSQESFGRLSHLSGTISRRLQNILIHVEGAPLKSGALRDATSVAIDEMMAEHEEWFMLYSLRDIDFPH